MDTPIFDAVMRTHGHLLFSPARILVPIQDDGRVQVALPMITPAVLEQVPLDMLENTIARLRKKRELDLTAWEQGRMMDEFMVEAADERPIISLRDRPAPQ